MYPARRIGQLALLSAVVALGAASAGPVRAQNTDGDVSNKKVTLNFENADIRYALKMLFNMVGVNYLLDENVQGAVTASLTDVTFRVALENILRTTQSQVPLTYRVQDGVYTVSLKQQELDQTTGTTTTETQEPEKKSRTVKIVVNYADAVELSYNLGGSAIMSNMRMGGGGFGGGYGGGGYGGGGYGGGGYGGGGYGGGGYGGGGFGGGGFGGGGFGGGGFGGGGFGGGGFGGGGFGGGGFGGGGYGGGGGFRGGGGGFGGGFGR